MHVLRMNAFKFAMLMMSVFSFIDRQDLSMIMEFFILNYELKELMFRNIVFISYFIYLMVD